MASSTGSSVLATIVRRQQAWWIGRKRSLNPNHVNVGASASTSTSTSTSSTYCLRVVQSLPPILPSPLTSPSTSTSSTTASAWQPSLPLSPLHPYMSYSPPTPQGLQPQPPQRFVRSYHSSSTQSLAAVAASHMRPQNDKDDDDDDDDQQYQPQQRGRGRGNPPLSISNSSSPGRRTTTSNYQEHNTHKYPFPHPHPDNPSYQRQHPRQHPHAHTHPNQRYPPQSRQEYEEHQQQQRESAIRSHQLSRWNKRQGQLIECLEEYQSLLLQAKNVDLPKQEQQQEQQEILYDNDDYNDHDNDNDNDNDPVLPNHRLLSQEWLEAVRHPSVADITWQELLETEHLFATLCRHCHEGFITLTSLNTLATTTTTTNSSLSSTNSNSNNDHRRDHPRRGRDDNFIDGEWMRQAQVQARSSAQGAPLGNPFNNNSRTNHHHHTNDTNADWTLAQMQLLLPFWERLRAERRALVESLAPPPTGGALNNDVTDYQSLPITKGKNERVASSSSSISEIEQASSAAAAAAAAAADIGNAALSRPYLSWMEWLPSILVGRSVRHPHDEDVDIGSPPSTITTALLPTTCTAHQEQEFAPNRYHYTKLIGRLYFHLPNLTTTTTKTTTTTTTPSNDDDKYDPRYEYNDENWYTQRAAAIHNVVRLAPHPDVLTNKMIRLLVRAYQDIGTLQASQQAEAVFREYPAFQQQLLWYVLMSYLQVVQQSQSQSQSQTILGDDRDDDDDDTAYTAPTRNTLTESERDDQAAQATQRVCVLLLDPRMRFSSNEFQSLVTIAFQCLAKTCPRALSKKRMKTRRDGNHDISMMTTDTVTAESGYSDDDGDDDTWSDTVPTTTRGVRQAGADGAYYELVDTLARRKFGRDVWRLLSRVDRATDPPALRPKDTKSLELLIQIYTGPSPQAGGKRSAEQAEHLRRAQSLLDTMFQAYSVADLHDSVKRSTFHSILYHLSRRSYRQQDYYRRHNIKDDSEDGVDDQQVRDFQYAMDAIVDRMVLAKPWRPNADTWRYLFRIAKTGPQADQVWLKYELCNGLMGHYTFPPLQAAKYVLSAWSSTSIDSADTSAQAPSSQAVQRAWGLFQFLDTYSTPYFFNHKPSKVSHLYSLEDAPDSGIYTIFWKICSRAGDWTMARKVYELAKEQRLRGATAASHHHHAPPLVFSSEMYVDFLGCLVECPDEAEKLRLADELYEDALENDKLSKSILNPLKLIHPELYQQHMRSEMATALNGSEIMASSLEDDDKNDRSEDEE